VGVGGSVGGGVGVGVGGGVGGGARDSTRISVPVLTTRDRSLFVQCVMCNMSPPHCPAAAKAAAGEDGKLCQ
jgi:hypothetical protein